MSEPRSIHERLDAIEKKVFGSIQDQKPEPVSQKPKWVIDQNTGEPVQIQSDNSTAGFLEEKED